MIAEELIINVDGGHINTTEEGKRSFEAMTAVIYRPEALVSNDKGTRNTFSTNSTTNISAMSKDYCLVCNL
jgi:hypothetical protein